MYKNGLKRIIDFICSLCALIILSPVLIILIVFGTIFMGGNPFFTQPRPGKNEKIFNLVKFRTMDNRKNKNGELLPDEVRLNQYGRFLRNTSLDELPELINILKGDMAVIGPRPQLVRDMVFMTDEQRKRHTVRPGLSGLAQVNGRNVITWEDKLKWDLKYIENITFLGDVSLILQTIGKVFKRADINREGTASDIDFGVYLLGKGEVSREEYNRKQAEAKELLKRR
ncbi:sugar transferase [Longibaculum muris]|uniref:sugar transferase n=1 Tax=Longibaculum muris TaxID=1796628 RepID=UPI0022E0980E|nr:sugar transferase [Longibaculum muris]